MASALHAGFTFVISLKYGRFVLGFISIVKFVK